jgi:hypothetical protein
MVLTFKVNKSLVLHQAPTGFLLQEKKTMDLCFDSLILCPHGLYRGTLLSFFLVTLLFFS